MSYHHFLLTWESIAFKQFSETSFVKVKLEGIVPCSLFNFIAVINEVSLFHLWVPYMMGVGLKTCTEIDRPTRFAELVFSINHRLRVVGHIDIALPWPLNPRDLAVHGYGVDLLDHDEHQGRVMIVVGLVFFEED